MTDLLIITRAEFKLFERAIIKGDSDAMLLAALALRAVQEREGPTVSTKFAKINGVLRPLWFIPEPPK